MSRPVGNAFTCDHRWSAIRTIRSSSDVSALIDAELAVVLSELDT